MGLHLLMDTPYVSFEVRGEAELFVADGAQVRFDSGVNLHVSPQAAGTSELGAALITLVPFLPGVHRFVAAQVS